MVACSAGWLYTYFNLNANILVLHSAYSLSPISDRSHDFSIGKFDDRTVILCDQVLLFLVSYSRFSLPTSFLSNGHFSSLLLKCEKEYHVGCLRENELCDLKVSHVI